MRNIGLVALGIFIVGRLYALHGIDAAVPGLGAVALFGSMVWGKDFWAEYLLPFGFWASKASDFEHPGPSAGGVAIVGWVLLIVLAWAVYAMQ